MRLTSRQLAALALAASAAVLAACGGGGNDSSPAANIRAVKVVGDSLADSGTFGFKPTVQGDAPVGPGSTPIWPERIASQYSVTLCPHYRAASATTFAAPVASCTNYAVAGGRVNYPQAPTSPFSIVQQISDLGAAGFASTDLVLVDGGGNDAADLIGAYLLIPSDHGATYLALLKTLLPAAMVDQGAAAGATGLAQLGGAYMQALSDKLSNSIKTNLLDKGAPRVAILNAPSVDKTPRVGYVLAAVTQAQGAAAAQQLQQLISAWVTAFNSRLNANFGADKRVAIADFFTNLNNQVADPHQYGLTNGNTPACPITGVDASGLPVFNFPTCTATYLSAHPPAGQTAPDWWTRYGFSDGFHPTPYGHQLLSELMARSIAQAGWL